MDAPSLSTPAKEKSLVVVNWPMSLETTRTELSKAQRRLEQYQAALRLANIEIERRNRGIIALTTLAYQANRVANPADLLRLALSQALETTRAPVGAIVLIDTETKELILAAYKGLTSPFANILSGQELEAGAVSLMPHLAAGAGALLELDTAEDETERLLLTTAQLTSLVSLPLQLGPRLMGALLVGLKDKRAFKPDELYVLMAMSREVAIALESLHLRDGLWHTVETLLGMESGNLDLAVVEQANLDTELVAPIELSPPVPTPPESSADDLEQLLAAMMEAETEVQQHNTDLLTLNTITEMMNSTLDLKQILQRTVDQTRAMLQTDAVWLYLLDDRNQLEMRAYTGLSIEYVRGMQHLKPEDGIEGRVAVVKKPLFVESVARDTHRHKIWVDKEKLHALAAVPITRPELTVWPGPANGESTAPAGQAGAHVLGVLATGKRDPQAQPWNPREIRLLTSIANQVALAIDNARLYAQVQEGETGLRVGNEVLRSINDMMLEKNAYLEGFIQDDLLPALTHAGQGLQGLLAENPNPLADGQKQQVAELQEIIYHLSELARETHEVSAALDTEFNQAIDRERSLDYAGSARPPRLQKSSPAEKPASPGETNNNGDHPASPLPGSGNSAKPMSFEEAVAAGLVPAHIVNKEKKS
ncbi:MAG: GAF domain-containing protein [Anaerolineae bacterium]|nr:GAF domain-containing protein [Anaerolineae bacterium]